MVEVISLPTFPPGNVWDLYILFLIAPILLRVLLLVGPFVKVTRQLSPHGGWILKRIRELPIKGLGLIAFNEILAFSLPIIVVLIFRTFSDSLGWNAWSETPFAGILILLLFGLLWIFIDLIRILRIRRMLAAIQKRNIDNLRKVAEVGFSVKRWLQRFSKKDKAPVKTATKSIGKKVWKARKINPGSLLMAVATGAAIEVARHGAGKISDRIDEKMQDEFDKIASSNSNMLLILLLRDFAMGLAPLFILWLVPLIFP